jgi:hypothetical protein
MTAQDHFADIARHMTEISFRLVLMLLWPKKIISVDIDRLIPEKIISLILIVVWLEKLISVDLKRLMTENDHFHWYLRPITENDHFHSYWLSYEWKWSFQLTLIVSSYEGKTSFPLILIILWLHRIISTRIDCLMNENDHFSWYWSSRLMHENDHFRWYW